MGGKVNRVPRKRRKRAFFRRSRRGSGVDVQGVEKHTVRGTLVKMAYHPPVRPNRSQHRGG